MLVAWNGASDHVLGVVPPAVASPTSPPASIYVASHQSESIIPSFVNYQRNNPEMRALESRPTRAARLLQTDRLSPPSSPPDINAAFPSAEQQSWYNSTNLLRKLEYDSLLQLGDCEAVFWHTLSSNVSGTVEQPVWSQMTAPSDSSSLIPHARWTHMQIILDGPVANDSNTTTLRSLFRMFGARALVLGVANLSTSSQLEHVDPSAAKTMLRSGAIQDTQLQRTVLVDSAEHSLIEQRILAGASCVGSSAAETGWKLDVGWFNGKLNDIQYAGSVAGNVSTCFEGAGPGCYCRSTNVTAVSGNRSSEVSAATPSHLGRVDACTCSNLQNATNMLRTFVQTLAPTRPVDSNGSLRWESSVRVVSGELTVLLGPGHHNLVDWGQLNLPYGWSVSIACREHVRDTSLVGIEQSGGRRSDKALACVLAPAPSGPDAALTVRVNHSWALVTSMDQPQNHLYTSLQSIHTSRLPARASFVLHGIAMSGLKTGAGGPAGRKGGVLYASGFHETVVSNCQFSNCSNAADGGCVAIEPVRTLTRALARPAMDWVVNTPAPITGVSLVGVECWDTESISGRGGCVYVGAPPPDYGVPPVCAALLEYALGGIAGAVDTVADMDPVPLQASHTLRVEGSWFNNSRAGGAGGGLYLLTAPGFGGCPAWEDMLTDNLLLGYQAVVDRVAVGLMARLPGGLPSDWLTAGWLARAKHLYEMVWVVSPSYEESSITSSSFQHTHACTGGVCTVGEGGGAVHRAMGGVGSTGLRPAHTSRLSNGQVAWVLDEDVQIHDCHSRNTGGALAMTVLGQAHHHVWYMTLRVKGERTSAVTAGYEHAHDAVATTCAHSFDMNGRWGLGE